ncbi:MAG: ribosome maturation factor RimM [Sulfuricella denitrificans]|nr:ribosome maturation factor RimM [Sulfuricella denitrificans]
MGHIGVPFGVRGWVKIYAHTEYSDSLLDYPAWWLGKNGQWREVRVQDSEVHSKSLVVHLEGCDDRDAAAALRGSEIAVPRDALPEPAENEYYWADLIGLSVLNSEQQALGMVSELLETGANDVLVVQQGEQERLIPFVPHVIQEVNLAAGTIRVDWGLDW